MAFCGREWQAAQEQGYIPLLKGTLDTEARVLLGQLGIDEAALDLRKVVEILFG
jgi:hypothetical protein